MLIKAFSRFKLGACLLFLSAAGCTSLTDWKYEVGQKIRSGQAWRNFDACNEECFTCDYRTGWKAGYYDVLTGGTGCPPVFAPRKYWKPPVFTELDPHARDDWYRGFQDGAACARCQPDTHYLKPFLPASYSASHSQCQNSGVPSYFPIESVVPDTIIEAPVEQNYPTDPVEAPGSTNHVASPELLTQPSPVAGALETDVAPEATPEPAVNDYERDPAPASSSSTPQAETPAPNQSSAIKRLVEQNRQVVTTVEPPKSLVDQLVLNVDHGVFSDDGFFLDDFADDYSDFR